MFRHEDVFFHPIRNARERVQEMRRGGIQCPMQVKIAETLQFDTSRKATACASTIQLAKTIVPVIVTENVPVLLTSATSRVIHEIGYQPVLMAVAKLFQETSGLTHAFQIHLLLPRDHPSFAGGVPEEGPSFAGAVSETKTGDEEVRVLLRFHRGVPEDVHPVQKRPKHAFAAAPLPKALPTRFFWFGPRTCSIEASRSHVVTWD
jgi:hypothetical protein